MQGTTTSPMNTHESPWRSAIGLASVFASLMMGFATVEALEWSQRGTTARRLGSYPVSVADVGHTLGSNRAAADAPTPTDLAPDTPAQKEPEWKNIANNGLDGARSSAPLGFVEPSDEEDVGLPTGPYHKDGVGVSQGVATRARNVVIPNRDPVADNSATSWQELEWMAVASDALVQDSNNDLLHGPAEFPTSTHSVSSLPSPSQVEPPVAGVSLPTSQLAQGVDPGDGSWKDSVARLDSFELAELTQEPQEFWSGVLTSQSQLPAAVIQDAATLPLLISDVVAPIVPNDDARTSQLTSRGPDRVNSAGFSPYDLDPNWASSVPQSSDPMPILARELPSEIAAPTQSKPVRAELGPPVSKREVLAETFEVPIPPAVEIPYAPIQDELAERTEVIQRNTQVAQHGPPRLSVPSLPAAPRTPGAVDPDLEEFDAAPQVPTIVTKTDVPSRPKPDTKNAQVANSATANSPRKTTGSTSSGLPDLGLDVPRALTLREHAQSDDTRPKDGNGPSSQLGNLAHVLNRVLDAQPGGSDSAFGGTPIPAPRNATEVPPGNLAPVIADPIQVEATPRNATRTPIAGSADVRHPATSMENANPGNTDTRRGEGRTDVTLNTDAARVARADVGAPVVPSPRPNPEQPAAQPLVITRRMALVRPEVDKALRFYFDRPLNTKDDSAWSVMHSFLGFGINTPLAVDGKNGRRTNAVGWMCANNPCAGRRLLVLQDGLVKGQEGPGFQGHPAQFLAMLAQIGIPANHPLSVQGKSFTVWDLVESEMRSCRSGEEMTFKLIAFSHYLEPDSTWVSASNEKWDVSKLLLSELSQPVNGVACGGTHRIMACSVAVQVREQQGRPLDGVFAQAKKYVRDYQRYALTLMNRDGSFSSDWFKRRADWGDKDRQLQTTGHMLEWLVFSLPAAELADARVVQGVEFLANLMNSNRYHEWEVGPRGHALRALALYQQRAFATAASAATNTMTRRPAVSRQR